MKNLKFTTNINCGGCVSAVTPFLKKESGISKWNVDTTDTRKILTVSTQDLNAADVIKVVQAAGFRAESL